MTRVHHVNVVVPVGEVDESLGFYEEVFGFVRIPKAADAGPGGAWLQVDEATQLHLSERDGAPHAEPHVAYLVDDFDGVRARAVARGAPWEDRPGRAFTRDPAGNRIEVVPG